MKLTSLLTVFALTATPAMAADKMKLLLDWFVNPDHGPIIVAQEKGYFAGPPSSWKRGSCRYRGYRP